MSEAQAKGIEALIGREMSSVEFVRDYVQLRFDGPCLTAVTMPVVRVSGAALLPGASGYRDALVEQVGQVVADASARVGDAIRITFSSGVTFEVSLRPEDYRYGPEAAILDKLPDGSWDVW